MRAPGVGFAAVALVAALAGAGGCQESLASAGDACARSTECERGLACVEGTCSRDLGPLEDPSRVPMLTPPEPADAAAPAQMETPEPPPVEPMPPVDPTMDASTGAVPPGS